MNDAPARVLTENTDFPDCGDLIDRLAYWVVPGTVDQALAYERAHPPAKLAYTGGGTLTDGNGTEKSLAFGNISEAGDGSDVEIAIAALHGSVGIRVDARALWNGPDCVIHH